jgi:hypothetical protein
MAVGAFAECAEKNLATVRKVPIKTIWETNLGLPVECTIAIVIHGDAGTRFGRLLRELARLRLR